MSANQMYGYNPATEDWEPIESSGGALAVSATSSGGLTQAEVKTAIEAATNLDGVETSLSAILAKLSSDPATQTTLAAILAKLIANPATETTLAAILAKLIANPATETTLDAIATKTPALGQALAAASSPVVLPAAQAAALAQDASLQSILTQLQSDLATLKTNTGRISPYQFQLAQDTPGTVFLVRYDSSTGTVINLTLAGAPFTPTGAVELTDPGSSPLMVQVNEFEATVTAPGWTNGDILTRIMVVSSTGAVVSTAWQDASGATLASPPIIGSQCVDADRQQLALIRSLQTAFGTQAQTPATDDNGVWPLMGLFKRLLGKFQIGGQSLATSVGVALPRKLAVGGAASVSTHLNLLDQALLSAATDVRDYQSAVIYVSAIATTGSFTFEGAYDSTFSTLSQPLTAIEIGVTPQVAVVGDLSPISGIRAFLVDLRGVNYLRVNLTVAATNVRAYAVLSQMPPTYSPSALATTAIAAPTAIVDITSNSIAAAGSTISGQIQPQYGTLASFVVDITATGGTGTLQLQVDETYDGVRWFNLYTSPVYSAIGTFRSKPYLLSGRAIRYTRIKAGTGAVTHSVVRSQASGVVAATSGSYATVNTTITTGGTARSFTGAPNLSAYEIQNTSTGDLWIRFDGVAALNAGIRLQAGQAWSNPSGFCPDTALSIWGATTGQTFSYTRG